MALPTGKGPAPRLFPETQWLLISCRAGQSRAKKAKAVAAMCQIYWPPLFRVLRERGFTADDAQDLTQGFLLRFIEDDSLARADPSKGRFRNYLLGSLDHYLTDVRRRAARRKRGGGIAPVSLDDPAARDIAQNLSPPRSDRAWATALLRKVVATLEMEYLQSGKGNLYRLLKPHWSGADKRMPYEKIAQLHHRAPATLRSDVHRIRARFAELLRGELRARFGEARVEEELQNLRATFRSS